MSRAAKTMFVWSIYLLTLRATLVIAPNVLVLFFGAFVALGFVKPVLLLLGMVDLAAAVWTGVSLRRDGT